MSNYKIRVNSEAESKEAQELFFELDYNWFKKGYVEVKTPETIMSFENGALSTGIRGSINHKETTLPELRDLVVLKRNNREELKGRADLLSGRIIIDDEPLKVIDSEYSKDGNSVTHTVSLNDQYAEIEKVRQSHRTASETADPTIKETLSQRQDQYGSFEDVAMITEQMVDIMRKGYYEKLAYNQKMALYMICSKMARIVNGNPNHKDSWHDIAGYATLIDNELVSEKDMPF